MSTTFPFNYPFDLTEFSMIGGSYHQLVFAVYDDGGNAVNLSGGTIAWYLSHYGSSVAVVTKAGVSGSATNIFKINLDGADTLSLSGKFIQQYRITDSSGSLHRPSQGLVNLYPALA